MRVRSSLSANRCLSLDATSWSTSSREMCFPYAAHARSNSSTATQPPESSVMPISSGLCRSTRLRNLLSLTRSFAIGRFRNERPHAIDQQLVAFLVEVQPVFHKQLFAGISIRVERHVVRFD